MVKGHKCSDIQVKGQLKQNNNRVLKGAADGQEESTNDNETLASGDNQQKDTTILLKGPCIYELSPD